MTNGFTPTQKDILNVLSDGMPHLRQELLDCLDDPAPVNTHLNMALCYLRKKLRPEGQDIVCELMQRRIGYRHVRLLGPSSE